VEVLAVILQQRSPSRDAVFSNALTSTSFSLY